MAYKLEISIEDCKDTGLRPDDFGDALWGNIGICFDRIYVSYSSYHSRRYHHGLIGLGCVESSMAYEQLTPPKLPPWYHLECKTE